MKDTRIVVLESNEAYLYALLQMLEECGICPEKVTSHLSLDSFSKGVYDLAFDHIVLSPLWLIDTGGHELLEAIKAQLPSAVCLLLAERQEAKQAESLLAKGADDYLFKGDFDLAFLKKSLQFALDRHKQRIATTQAQRQFKAIYEHSTNAILLANDQMEYQGANPSACKMLGYTEEELMQLKVDDVVQEPNRMGTSRHWQHFLKEQNDEGSIILRTKNGQSLIASYKAVANILPGMHLSILQDITHESLEHQRNKLLAEVYKITSNEEDFQASIESILHRVCESTGYSGGELWWIGERSESLFYKGGYYCKNKGAFARLKKLSPSIHIPMKGSSLLSCIFSDEDPVEIKHIAQHPDFYRRELFAGDSDFEGIAVPIFKESTPLGCMLLFRELTPDNLSASEIGKQLLKSLAPILGVEAEKMRMRSSLQQVIANAHDLIGIIGFDRRLVEVNPAMEQALGYSQLEMTGMDTLDLVAPEYYEQAQKLLERAMTGGGFSMQDILLVTKSGVQKWIELSATPNLASSSVYFIGRDVTHEKVAREKLLAANRKYQLATRTTQLGIWELDLQNETVLFDDGVANIYGISQDETPMHRQQWKTFLHPDDQQRVLDAFAHAIATGEALSLNYRIISKESVEKNVKVSAEVLRNAQGTVEGMVGLTLDITDYVRSENEKAQALEKLKERIKEQACLYQLSQLIQEESEADILLKKAVQILPYGWQFPKITEAAIEFGTELYTTKGFKQTQWMQTSEEKQIGNVPFKIHIAYTQPTTERDEGPFLKEERTLIVAIADNLVGALEHISSKKLLQQSESRFRNLIENNYDVILVQNEDFKIQYISPSCERLAGYTPEEVLGNPSIHFIHPDDIEARNAAIGRLLSGEEKIVIFKERIKCKDGNYTWVEATVTDQRKNAGINGLVYNLRGIDKEERFRKDLEENRDRLIRAQQMARMGYWKFNLHTYDLYWSPEVYDLHGVNPDTFEAKFENFLKYVHPEDLHMFSPESLARLQERESDALEYRIIDEKGKLRWLRGKANLVRSSEKGTALFEGAVQDITQQKLLELELREREHLLSLFIENSPALTWLKDTDGNVIAANTKFLEMTGRTAADIGRKNHLTPDMAAPESLDNDLKVIETGMSMRFTENVPDSTGVIRVYDVFKFPVVSKGNTLVGGFALDVTKKREYLKAIEEQNEKLREIAWTQSHVVRAPLSRILGLVDHLKYSITKDEQCDIEALSYIEEAATELDDIIQEMIRTADGLNIKYKAIK